MRRIHAFTLVEIAIALSIIGILASTAGVHYLHMLERARIARTIVELRGIAAEIDPMGDEHASLPRTLAEAGIHRMDAWGRPYQFLLLEGELPPGVSSMNSGLPNVAAPPTQAGRSGNGNAGNGGNTGAGGGPSAIALARKDRFLVPINSDYDLYSLGPDGESHVTLRNPVSRDDIIRAANGAYYGLAEKF